MVSQRVFHSKKLSLWNSAYHLGQKIYYLTVHCLNLTSTLPAVTPSSKPKSFISSTVLLPSFTFKSLHPASSSPTPSLIPPPGSASLWATGYPAGGGGAGICSAACCAWRSRRLSGGEKPAGFWWARGVISSFHRRPAKWKESGESEMVVEGVGGWVNRRAL